VKGIPWEDMSAAEVEDLCSMLLLRVHPTAYALDGSGGDGGRDVVLPGNDDAGDTFFEIKSFRERIQPDGQRWCCGRALRRRLRGIAPSCHLSPAYFSHQEYTSRMRTRLTITVDKETAAVAEAAVAAGQAPSVSAWVAAAMGERARREQLGDVLAEIRADLGPATDEETAWARSVLGL